MFIHVHICSFWGFEAEVTIQKYGIQLVGFKGISTYLKQALSGRHFRMDQAWWSSLLRKKRSSAAPISWCWPSSTRRLELGQQEVIGTYRYLVHPPWHLPYCKHDVHKMEDSIVLCHSYGLHHFGPAPIGLDRILFMLIEAFQKSTVNEWIGTRNHSSLEQTEVEKTTEVDINFIQFPTLFCFWVSGHFWKRPSHLATLLGFFTNFQDLIVGLITGSLTACSQSLNVPRRQTESATSWNSLVMSFPASDDRQVPANCATNIASMLGMIVLMAQAGVQIQLVA